MSSFFSFEFHSFEISNKQLLKENFIYISIQKNDFFQPKSDLKEWTTNFERMLIEQTTYPVDSEGIESAEFWILYKIRFEWFISKVIVMVRLN